VLTDGAGNLVPDGNYPITFNIYDDATLGGPHLLWSEPHTAVAVSKGGFSVILGSITPLALAFDTQYWLGVQVGADPELTPRVTLAASPYSLRSSVAEGLAAPITGAQVLDGSLGSIDMTPTFAHSGTAATTNIGATWTNYSGGVVSINAPGPGYVAVDSDFYLLISHTAGIRDLAFIGIATGPTVIPNYMGLWAGEVPAGIPTQSAVVMSGHVQYVFVVAAGPQSYYLNGIMASGQDTNDNFWYANMSAIYYYNPSPSAPSVPEAVMQAKLAKMQALAGQAKSQN